MIFFAPHHRRLVRWSTRLAETIVERGTREPVGHLYDVLTAAEQDEAPMHGVFARLMRLEDERTGQVRHYRIHLQDEEIIRFLQSDKEVAPLAFLVFVLTHEIIHIQRFARGRADYARANHEEELFVDTLTRVLLAKNPLPGRQQVLTLLDKVAPAPLYKSRILVDQGGHINAYL